MTDIPKTGDVFRAEKEDELQAVKDGRKAFSIEEIPAEHLAILEASLVGKDDE